MRDQTTKGTAAETGWMDAPGKGTSPIKGSGINGNRNGAGADHRPDRTPQRPLEPRPGLLTGDLDHQIRLFYERTVNIGDVDALEQWVAPDVVNHSAEPGSPQGMAGFRARQATVRTAFPDFRIEVLRTVVQGDMVVTHNRATGTHLGEFLGLSPTGRTIAAESIEVYRVSGGRIRDRWGVADLMGITRQLSAGGIPIP